jgi:hypothetical protein
MTWRTALGYTLHIRITIVSFEPNSDIGFTSARDLEGDERWQFQEEGQTTTTTIAWHMHTTRWWMNLCAPLLRPTFIASHHRLMRRGERGLRAYVQAV